MNGFDNPVRFYIYRKARPLRHAWYRLRNLYRSWKRNGRHRLVLGVPVGKTSSMTIKYVEEAIAPPCGHDGCDDGGNAMPCSRLIFTERTATLHAARGVKVASRGFQEGVILAYMAAEQPHPYLSQLWINPKRNAWTWVNYRPTWLDLTATIS